MGSNFLCILFRIWLSPLFSSEATDETDRKDHFKKDLFVRYLTSLNGFAEESLL